MVSALTDRFNANKVNLLWEYSPVQVFWGPGLTGTKMTVVHFGV